MERIGTGLIYLALLVGLTALLVGWFSQSWSGAGWALILLISAVVLVLVGQGLRTMAKRRSRELGKTRQDVGRTAGPRGC